jgi:mannose-6-phosphate isomerase
MAHCLQSVEVSAGDVVEIPAGIVHGLGAGILLAEIQQSSNLTYRIYDYDRVDAEGRTRPLHVERALEVIDFEPAKRVPVKHNIFEERLNEGVFLSTLMTNPYFIVEKYRMDDLLQAAAQGGRFAIWMVVEGSGSLSFAGDELPIKTGDTVFIPAAMGEYQLRGALTVLKVGLPG